MADPDALKRDARRWVDDHEAVLVEFEQELWNYHETAWREYQSAATTGWRRCSTRSSSRRPTSLSEYVETPRGREWSVPTPREEAGFGEEHTS
jgi:hypothetical protein